jgi:hypothetical protein
VVHATAVAGATGSSTAAAASSGASANLR